MISCNTILDTASQQLSDGAIDLPRHARSGHSISDLSAVAAEGVNLAIWQRRGERPPVDAALLEQVDDIAVEQAVDEIAATLPPMLADAGYAAAAARALSDDVAMLARALAAILGVGRVAIRLDVVETDACRRFHADYVTARLICTYAGPGTQWLDTADAMALADGAAPEELTIREIATGDAAVFKGRLWSGTAPIVHRSPPIAHCGDRRLLLVIDPAQGPN